MYQNATIVTLEPTEDGSDSIQSVRSATFEEAFGGSGEEFTEEEYSEARGKGRAKRQARKLDRQKNKAERKVAKQTTKQTKIKARQETKQLKKGGRQEARIGRRATRKQSRQEMRNTQQENRMGRKTNRLDMRQNRSDAKQTRKNTKALGEEGRENLGVEESTYRDNMLNENENLRENMNTENENYRENTNAENEAYRNSLQPEEEMDDSQDQTGYEESQADYSEEEYPEDEQGYQNEYSEEDYAEEEYPEDDAYYEEDGYADYDESESFDGDEFSQAEGEMLDKKPATKIDAKLQDVADKIEWNRILLQKLENRQKQRKGDPKATSKAIAERKRRVAELEGMLKSYSSFDDGFSSANGLNPEQIRKEVAVRTRKVGIAKQRAVQKRMDAKRTQPINKINQYNRKVNGGDSTPVDVELNPEFSAKRIVVPASSSFDSTGIIAIDNANDFDATEIDVMLGADGAGTPPYEYSSADASKSTSSKTKVNVAGIVVGLGLGVLAIWAVRKYKLLN
jgi:hypothetical protein